MKTKYLVSMMFVVWAMALSGCGSSSNDSPATTTGQTQNSVTDTDSDGISNDADNCPNDANADQADSDLDGNGDACDAIAGQYVFTSKYVSGESAVSYTGQNVRHLLIAGLVEEIADMTEDVGGDYLPELNFYFENTGNVADTTGHKFSVAGGEPVTPGPNFGDVSTDKNLLGKIAGNDKPEHILGGEFFGWKEDMDATPTPEELVDVFFNRLNSIATDGVIDTISVTGGATPGISKVYIDKFGRDYKQLIQKFLLGAVAFSQGTADYLKTNFQAANIQDNTNPYTAAGHDWDEAFGYFGAARDYNDYTDDEIRASGGDRRAEYENGYHDLNGDGLIDLRSEYNFGNAVNCAKRDAGASVATNFTKEIFDAFVLGRTILNNAENGTLSDAQYQAVQAQALIVARTWEKCIAATVVHYINEVTADINEYDGSHFADLGHYENLAKHWSEMKGFALALQFNPESPFRKSASVAITDLKQILTLLGDAPVLPDGTQLGVAYAGGVAQYLIDLGAAGTILQTAYEFHADNVAQW